MRQSLEDQAMEVIDRGRSDSALQVLPVDRRVRAFLGGTPVADSRRVLLMLERLVGHINAHSGVRWMTMEEIAEDFRRRQPFKAH